eukprot:SAG25_NODE_241_length_11184_cov_4.090934_9_plen_167_part_00
MHCGGLISEADRHRAAAAVAVAAVERAVRRGAAVSGWPVSPYCGGQDASGHASSQAARCVASPRTGSCGKHDRELPALGTEVDANHLWLRKTRQGASLRQMLTRDLVRVCSEWRRVQLRVAHLAHCVHCAHPTPNSTPSTARTGVRAGGQTNRVVAVHTRAHLSCA